MPDGDPELTLITPGRVGRGAGGRPPRAGVGLTTAVILHPRTPVPSPRRGRTRPHHAGAGPICLGPRLRVRSPGPSPRPGLDLVREIAG